MKEIQMRNVLVFDSDRFTGPDWNTALGWIESIDQVFDAIFVIGKQENGLKQTNRLLSWWFPDANIRVIRTEQEKGSTEAWCAFLLGKLLGEACNTPDAPFGIVILSTRWILASFVPELAERGFFVKLPESRHSLFLSKDFANVTILKMPDVSTTKLQKAHDEQPCRLPDWVASSAIDSKIGFDVLAVPSERLAPRPSFIPFPNPMSSLGDSSTTDYLPITIGKDAPSSLQLHIWEEGKKGIYSPHIEIDYEPFPRAKWVLRLCHGHRTGNNGVWVNDTLVTAAKGAITIKNGDEVQLGRFQLRFKTDRFEELLRYEEPYHLVKAIELRVKELADIAHAGIADLAHGNDMLGKPIEEWKQVSWGQFQAILKSLWDEPSFNGIRSKIESRRRLMSLLHHVKESRDTIGHPLKGEIDKIQKRDVVELFMLLKDSE